MSVRTDVTVDWEADPRVITVASPSTSINGQDMIDTLRSIEYKQEVGADVGAHPFLTYSFGKIEKGVGEYTRIILILNNARIAFQARAGPSFEACYITGVDLFAQDAAAASINPIHTTAYVQVNYEATTGGAMVDPEMLEFIRNMVYNKATKSGDLVTIYEPDGVTVWKVFNLSGGGRVEQ